MKSKKTRLFYFLIIDRYLLTEFVKHFIISLLLFVTVFFFAQLLAELPALLNKAQFNKFITLENIFKNYYYKLPFFTMTVFPFAFLFSTSYILGNFYKNNEITAMVSGGLSIRRLTASIIFFSILISVALMLFSFNWLPNASYKSAKLEEKLNREVKSKSVDNIQTFGKTGISYFATYYESKQKTFISFLLLKRRGVQKLKVHKEPFLNTLNSTENIKTQIDELTKYNYFPKVDFPYEWGIRGERLVYNSQLQKWIALKGTYWKWDEKGKLLISTPFQRREIDNIPEKPSFFSKETRKMSQMSLKDSKELIDKLRQSRQPYKKHLVEFYSEKYAKPFSVFILALLASAIGRFFSRKHLFIISLLSSFVIAVVYYVFLNVGISLGKEGVLPPLLAAFLGNILSLFTYFYLRSKQLT